MLSAASAGAVQLSQDDVHQQSSYQSRQESVPLFIVELDGQLKAFWNSSKLLIAPLTLKKRYLMLFNYYILTGSN